MKHRVKAFGICIYKTNAKGIKILLCKSMVSLYKWGCLKGIVKNDYESNQECAQREFFEESSINVDILDFEEYFEQSNIEKDIAIWLVNYDNVPRIDDYFSKNRLISRYLSVENSDVEFFDINRLPPIKNKQIFLVNNIVNFLKSKHQFH